MVQGDRGLYAAAKTRQNVEAACECMRVAAAAREAGQVEKAVRCQPAPERGPSHAIDLRIMHDIDDVIIGSRISGVEL